jgi:hypothetical protein
LERDEEFPSAFKLSEVSRRHATTDVPQADDRYGPKSPRVRAFIRAVRSLPSGAAATIEASLKNAGRAHYIGATRELYDIDGVTHAVRASGRMAPYRAAWTDGLIAGFDRDDICAGEMEFYWNFHGVIAEWAAHTAGALTVVDLVQDAPLGPLLTAADGPLGMWCAGATRPASSDT